MADEITSLEDASAAMIAAESGKVADSPAAATESEPVQPEGDTHTPAEWSRLMKESQSNRERAQEYERLYGQNSELQQFHEAAKAYADGDINKVQSWLLENAAAVQGLSLDDFMAKFEEPADDDDKPMTRREFKEAQERAAQAARAEIQQEQVGEIQAHATSLGYEVGSRLYNDLLWVAMNQTGNDLDAAHKIVSETPQQYIDEFVTQQREKSRQSLRPQPSARVPGTDREITNWDDATRAGEEFLRATQ